MGVSGIALLLFKSQAHIVVIIILPYLCSLILLSLFLHYFRLLAWDDMAESRDSSPICGYDEPRPPRPPFVPPLDLPPDLGEENSDEEVTSSDDLTSIRSHDNGSRPPRPDFVPPLDLTKLLSEEDDEDKTNNSGKTYFAAYPVDFPPR